MTRLTKPLGEWTADDVLALVAERVEEGQRLDYKRELSLSSRAKKLEAAKDASGMANATGGYLVYGVDEEETEDGRRLPSDPTPLAEGDGQARLEDVLWSAVSPPLNAAAVTLEAPGGYFVVLHVSQRSGPLHMVEAYGQHRYFIRSGLATRPMEAHEVERAFGELGGVESRIERVLGELPLVPRIANSYGILADQREPRDRPWSSVVAAPLDASADLINTRRFQRHDFQMPSDLPRYGEPSYVHVGSFEVDAHGYIDEVHGEDGYLLRLVRLYRVGWLEWGIRYGGGRGERIPTLAYAHNVHDALVYFAHVYRTAGYYGRVRVWVRIDNADRTEFILGQDARYYHDPRTPEEAEISFTVDTNVERLLDSPVPIVHEAMDHIWQAYGLDRALVFTPEGELRRS